MTPMRQGAGLADGVILMIALAVLLNYVDRANLAAGVFLGLSTPTMFAMTGTLAGPRAAGRWAGAQNVAGQLAGIIAASVL